MIQLRKILKCKLKFLPRRFTSMSILVSVVFGFFLATFLTQSFVQYVQVDFNEIEESYDKAKHHQLITDNNNATYVNISSEEIGKQLEKTVRVLCVIMTTAKDHDTRAQAVKNTWGKRCNELVFISTEANASLPAVTLSVSEGDDKLWGKTRETFRYVWNNFKDKADWFLKADDKTFVIVENLRYFLSGYNTSEPYWFGHKLKHGESKEGFLSPEAGYVLSKESTQRFVEEGYFNNLLCRHGHKGDESIEMGTCMRNLNVSAMDTRDSEGRARFLVHTPENYMFLENDKSSIDYFKKLYYPYQKESKCCSDSAITFRVPNDQDMYLMDFIIYFVRPFALNPDRRPPTPKLPPDFNLTATPWTFEEVINTTIKINGTRKKLEKEDRVLCWIMTKPENHKIKAQAVKNTWGKRCNELVFISTGADANLPTVTLSVSEGNDKLWGKIREAFRYVWNNYKDKTDWFLRADDETFVVVENLRYHLSGYNTSEPYWFGHKLKNDENKEVAFSPGAGYILSKEATRKFVEEGYFNNLLCRHDHTGNESKEMETCMRNLNVSAVDTSDFEKYTGFSSFSQERNAFLDYEKKQFEILRKIRYPNQTESTCCFESPVSVHKVNEEQMYMMDLYLYNAPSTPKPKLS